MKILSSLVGLFYPNRCLHCYNKAEKNYFCKNCISSFSFMYPQKNINAFAVFEKKGAVSSFLSEIKKMQIYSLIKLAASFIVIQHSKLDWEIPSVIVPVSKKMFFKDYIYYLSKEVAILFDRPLSIKSNSDQTALFIDDIFSMRNFEKIKKEYFFKKIFYMSLCFDVFSDDFFI